MQVTYYLKAEDTNNFHIDSYTGEITTRKQFDREEQRSEERRVGKECRSWLGPYH